MGNKIFNQNTKNTISNVLDALFIPLAALMATPFFIHKLGIEEYGLWMFINTLISSVSILNLGGANVAIKFVAAYREENNTKKIQQIFSTIFTVQAIIGIVILVVTILCARFIASIDLLDIESKDRVLFDNLVALSCGVLIIKMLEQVVTGFLKGFERYDLAALFSISSKLMLLLAQILTAILGGDLGAILLNSLTILIITLVVQMASLRFYHPDLRYFRNFNISILKQMLGFSWWTWLLSSTLIIVSQLDRWIIGLLAGLEVLGFYSIAYMMLNNIHMILSSSVAWVFPKVSKYGINDYTSKLFFRGHSFVVMASTFVSLTLLIFQDVFLIWLGESTYKEAGGLIEAMLVIIPIYSLSILSFYYINGVGCVKYNLYNALAAGVLRGILMFALFRYFGATGIIYAIGFSSLIMAIHYLWIIKHKILIPGISSKFFFIPVFVYTLMATAAISNVQNGFIVLIFTNPIIYYIVYKNELNFDFFKDR